MTEKRPQFLRLCDFRMKALHEVTALSSANRAAFGHLAEGVGFAVHAVSVGPCSWGLV